MMRKVFSIALLLVPAVASGQQSSVDVSLSNIDGQVCTNGSFAQIIGTGAVSTSCTADAGRFNLAGASSNFGGILRAQSSMNVSSGAPLRTLAATGEAAWADVLNFTRAPGSAAPTRVEFRYLLTGSMGGSNVRTNLTLLGNAGVTGAALTYAKRDSLFAGKSNITPGGLTIPFQSFSDELFWRIPILGGVGSINFELTMIAMVQGNPGLTPINGFSDFSHTMGLSGLVFFDASDNDVTKDISYSFQNGTQFVTTSTVPEPGTWILTLSGLTIVGLVAKRRRVSSFHGRS